MISAVIIISILQICSVYSDSDSRRQVELLNSNSVIYELVNNVSDIGFESESRCKEELLLIKAGIRKKDVWAFKRKYQVSFRY